MYNDGARLPLPLTFAQASIVYAALQVFITDAETAIHMCNDVHADHDANDILITAIESCEEAQLLRDRILKQYGLAERF